MKGTWNGCTENVVVDIARSIRADMRAAAVVKLVHSARINGQAP